ncbi:MFS general substrate transporter [Aspergillus heterothallicus]
MSPAAQGSKYAPGHSWRSSKLLMITAISIAMLTDTFLFSFIIPILPEILEGRLQVSPTHTQLLTSTILSMNAIVSIVIAPLIAYLSDRTRRKNTLMLLAYLLHLVGTAVTAWSTTVASLLIGRLVQTFAGSLLWIAGMAMLGATVEPKQLARTFAICTLFVTVGLLSGPVVGAALFSSVSYSLTWVSAFAVLLVGIVVQSCIIEPYTLQSKEEHMESSDHRSERDALLPPVSESSSPCDDYRSFVRHLEEPPLPPASSTQIYWKMLAKRRVNTALIAEMLLAVLISSFEATIPLHIKDVFHWQSLQAGILFLLLQLPTIILVFPAGWLKDKLGMRLPVTTGFILMAPSLWLLGVPGAMEFDGWADSKTGQNIYIVAILTIGVCRTLILGLGGVEVLRGAAELANEFPGIFGASTGHSRAFVLSNVTWKFGMFVGPLFSGFLTEDFGYYWMNLILGECGALSSCGGKMRSHLERG